MSGTGRCRHFEELISAELDGEASPAEHRRLDRHLTRCAPCRTHHRLAGDLHRRTRLRPSPAIPDLTGPILAASAVPDRGDATPDPVPAATNEPVHDAAPTRTTSRRWGGVTWPTPTSGAASAVATAAVLLVVVGLIGPPWFVGSTPAPRLRAVDGVVTAAEVGTQAAVYLTLVNDGGHDRLVGGRVIGAGDLAVHTSEHHHGVEVMLTRNHHPVASQAMTLLRPGGGHLMVEQAPPGLHPGRHVDLELVFERSGPVRLTIPVVAPHEVTDRLTPA